MFGIWSVIGGGVFVVMEFVCYLVFSVVILKVGFGAGGFLRDYLVYF